MKLKSRKITANMVHQALYRLKSRGKIPSDVDFDKFQELPSRYYTYAYQIHIGTRDQLSLPIGYVDQNGRKMRVRRRANSGSDGAGALWAATYHEWGWFIAEIFALDPNAVFGDYGNAHDFHKKTKGVFRVLPIPPKVADPGLEIMDGWVKVVRGFPYINTYLVRAQ